MNLFCSVYSLKVNIYNEEKNIYDFLLNSLLSKNFSVLFNSLFVFSAN